MLDLADTPTFLVEHWIVDDAADGEFGILLYWIVLQVFIAAIAVDQVQPVGIALTDATTEGNGHGSRFDVERLIVFEDANGLAYVEHGWVRLDRFEKEGKAKLVKKAACLLQVRSIAEVEDKGLQP